MGEALYGPRGDLVWEAQPKQDLALRCHAFEVLFGGAKGGGKSDYLIMAPKWQIAAAQQAWRETGERSLGRAIIFRHNYKDLKDMLARAEKIWPRLVAGVKKPTDKNPSFIFPSGYRLDFEHLADADAWKAFEGQQITFLGVDQAESTVPEEGYEVLRAQVRTTEPALKNLLAVRLTANPGGKYQDYLKKRFVDPHPPGGKILRETIKLRDGRTIEQTRAFIRSYLWDNKYLAEDGVYEARLRMAPPHLQKAYIEGDWDYVLGAAFSDLWRPDIHIIEPRKYFEIPSHWELRMGGDWGITSPSSVHFGTRDQDGRIIITDEIYKPGKTGSVFGEAILEYVARRAKQAEITQGEHCWHLGRIPGFLDPSAWGNHGGEGASPAATMQHMGILWRPALNNRIAGINQVRERLRLVGERPQIYIFRRCENLIRTLPCLPSSPKDPEDVDTDAEDHAYDSLRYLCMSWPIDLRKPNYDRQQQEMDGWAEQMKRHAAALRQRPEDDELSFTGRY